MFLFRTILLPNGNPLLFFKRGSVWWAFGQDNNPIVPVIKAYSSADGGHTFNELDAGNEFTTDGWADSAMGQFYDGDHTVTFFYQAGAFSGDLYLIQFDLNSSTYGARFAHQNVPTGDTIPTFVAQLSSGHFVGVSHVLGTAGKPYTMQVWDGATWTAGVDACAGAEVLPGFSTVNTSFINSLSAVVDSGDVLHIIYSTTSTDPSWDNRFFYQEILPDGTLQNFHEFPGQSGSPQDLANVTVDSLTWGPLPNLIISGGKLFWGIVRNGTPQIYPSMYVGSPLINPTWTERGNLDPGALPGSSGQVPLSYPAIYSQGGFLAAEFQRIADPNDGGFQAMELSTTDDFATALSTVLIDTSIDPTEFSIWPAFLWFDSGITYILSGQPELEGSVNLSFSAVTGSAPPPPTSQPLKITFRGVKRTRICPGNDTLSEVPVAPSVKRAV